MEFPHVTGFGTSLCQIIVLAAWAIVGGFTSGLYADTHHPVVWFVALVLNVNAFAIPATTIWLATRTRSSVYSSVALCAWCVFYLASLFWLFPATDGP